MTSTSELYRFPTTFSQRQLWYVQATAPQTTAYNIPFAFTLRGALDTSALEQALAELVARHDALRTHFEVHTEAVQQVIDMALRVPLELIDLSALDEDAQAQMQALHTRAVAEHMFDLSRPPLLVLRLLKLGSDRHVLLICVHHIVMDHLSVLQFGRELEALYADFRAGRRPAVQADGLQYPDYAVWQGEALDAAAIEAKLPYWVESLAGCPHQLELPTDFARPPLQSFRGGEVQVAFSADISRGLRAYAQREQQTLFTVMLGGLGVLLRGYTGQDRLIIGCPFANRGAEELESVMGLFMNLLPVGLEVDPQQPFVELVRAARRQMMKAQGVQDTPFEKIVQAVGVQRDPARNPLVQAWFTFQDAPMALELAGLKVDSRPLPNGGAKLDLSFWFWDDGERIRGLIEFDADLFEPATVERLGRRLEAVMAQVVADPAVQTGALSLIAPDEVDALAAASYAGAPTREWSSPHGAFFERAAAEPQRIALRAIDGEYSAGQLAARADAIAAALQQAGVGVGDIVGICLQRSADLVAALLGVLRAGAAYLPLDPDLPAERITYMRDDAGVRHVLVDAEAAARFDRDATVLIDVATLPSTAPSDFNPAPESPTALAYVIYTSGSTGRPKGVRLSQGAVGNFLASMADSPGLQRDDRVLALTTYAFDIAVLEIFLPLALGATLVLGQRSLLEATDALAAFIDAEQISVLQATPSTWRLLRAHDWAARPSLKALTGGEALGPDLAAWLLPRVGELWNMYGPTETTVWSSLQRIIASNVELCPIGHPVARTGLHVVDAQLQRLPSGIAGELLITGAGVAEGYHQRPELTAEKFIVLPDTGERAYRTGDLVLRLADGSLRHLGRRDQQIKIRGYRIELGEIESVLAAQPGITAAAAGVWRISDADHRLVAWYVAEPSAAPTLAELRAGLSLQLPGYMLPQHLLALPALPLLPNGKLNRAALPWPQLQAAAEVAAAALELGDEERLVLQTARELLGTELVELDDNFFEAGGHSLLALSLSTRLQKASGVKLSLLAIAHATLRAVAAQIANGGATIAEPRQAGLGAKVAKLFGFGR